MSRRLLVVLGVLATAFVLAARADDRLPVKIDPKSKGDVKRSDDATDPKVKIEDAATQQERLKRQFDDFKQRLLGLAQRMENSAQAGRPREGQNSPPGHQEGQRGGRGHQVQHPH